MAIQFVEVNAFQFNKDTNRMLLCDLHGNAITDIAPGAFQGDQEVIVTTINTL